MATIPATPPDNKNPETPSLLAKQYLARGWQPIPIKPKSKTPAISQWSTKHFTENEIDRAFADPQQNIAVLLGTPSNGLVDVDLDTPEAIALASAFLPPTGARFGRKSKPDSHWLYSVGGPEGRSSYMSSAGMEAEIRGIGHLTVFPGSVHESGETIKWVKDGSPSAATWSQLRTSVANVSAAALLLRAWKEGVRHDLSLAAAGTLLGWGVSSQQLEIIFRAVAAAAHDPEQGDRLASIRTTLEARDQDRPVTGVSGLEKFISRKDIEKIAQWVGATAAATAPADHAAASLPADRLSTDLGTAKAFAADQKHKLLYVERTKRWLQRSVHVFRPVGDTTVQGRGMHFVERCAAAFNGPGFLQQKAKQSLESRHRINDMIELSRSQLIVDESKIDQSSDLVGCADGRILDLEAGNILDDRSAAEHVVTKQIGTTFDPAARCPRFLAFLEQVLERDRDIIEFVQRATGYSLSGHVGEQCLFVMIGAGANGKSTFIHVIQKLLSNYAATTPMQTLMVAKSEQTNDLAALVGKRFVSASEGEPGQKLAESKLKLMTGMDPISCRALYENLFTYWPQFKLWLATNNLPTVSGQDEAIWRRIRVIKFPVTIPPEQRNPNLSDELGEELPGILNWALEGYREWRRGGLRAPDSVTAATSAYRMENDTIGQFIDACCETGEAIRQSSKILYERYKSWCEESGLDAVPKNIFGKTLKQKGFTAYKASNGNGWKGLRLTQMEILRQAMEFGS